MAIVTVNSKFIDTSMAATFTSDVVDLHRVGAASLELHADAGTHVGAITIEISNSNENWTVYGWADPSSGAWSTSITVAVTAAHNTFIDLSMLGARYVRVVYTTAPTGTGTLEGWIFGKNWSE